MSRLNFESEYVKVAVTEQTYNDNIQIPSSCNLMYFKNQGDTVVTLNGKRILQAGEDWGFAFNPGEYFDLTYDIVFSGAGTNNLYVMWKNP